MSRYSSAVLADDPALYWRLGDSGLPDPAGVRADTFERADNPSAWGAATDGHTWVAASTDVGASDSVSSGSGRSTADGDDNSTPWRLGPPLDADDAEVLVRWRVLGAGGGTTADGITLILRLDAGTDADSADLAVLFQGLDGTTRLYIAASPANDEYDDATWAGGAVGTAFWTRLRAVGLTYRWRSWPAETPEPGTWDGTHTTALAPVGRSVGLWGTAAAGHTVAVDHYSAGPYPPTIPLADASGHARTGTAQGALTCAAAGLLRADANTAVSTGGADGTLVQEAPSTLPAAASIEVWLRTTTTAGGVLAQFATADATQRDLTLYLRTDGVPAFRAGDTEIVRSPERTVADGRIHHLVATLDGDAAAWLYVDGAPAAHHAGVTPGSPFTGRWQMGAGTTDDLAVPPLSAAYAGTIDEVAIYVD